MVPPTGSDKMVAKATSFQRVESGGKAATLHSPPNGANQVISPSLLSPRRRMRWLGQRGKAEGETPRSPQLPVAVPVDLLKSSSKHSSQSQRSLFDDESLGSKRKDVQGLPDWENPTSEAFTSPGLKAQVFSSKDLARSDKPKNARRPAEALRLGRLNENNSPKTPIMDVLEGEGSDLTMASIFGIPASISIPSRVSHDDQHDDSHMSLDMDDLLDTEFTEEGDELVPATAQTKNLQDSQSSCLHDYTKSRQPLHTSELPSRSRQNRNSARRTPRLALAGDRTTPENHDCRSRLMESRISGLSSDCLSEHLAEDLQEQELVELAMERSLQDSLQSSTSMSTDMKSFTSRSVSLATEPSNDAVVYRSKTTATQAVSRNTALLSPDREIEIDDDEALLNSIYVSRPPSNDAGNLRGQELTEQERLARLEERLIEEALCRSMDEVRMGRKATSGNRR